MLKGLFDLHCRRGAISKLVVDGTCLNRHSLSEKVDRFFLLGLLVGHHVSLMEFSGGQLRNHHAGTVLL